jgi:5,10-methylenetetrahydrofolate reductase
VSFARQIREWSRPLTLYEVIPPDRSAPRETIADQARYITNLLVDHGIDAINIPEIRNEERNGDRVAGFMEKYDPRNFGMTIQDIYEGSIDLVVNHAVVYDEPDAQREWFQTTYEKFGIDSLVLVGGESSDVDYPGPSVPEAAQLAREVGDEFGVDPCLGAITIPTRRRESFDEPDRMLAKIDDGAEFFTSQVIYEADSTRRLLADYDEACREHGVDPAPVFLSFAPITGRKDARFLEWLGVRIPEEVKTWVLDQGGRPLDRSVRVAEHLLREILTFTERRELDVPVGINVEHIMRYNFDASEVLLDRLDSLLGWHQLETSETP